MMKRRGPNSLCRFQSERRRRYGRSTMLVMVAALVTAASTTTTITSRISVVQAFGVAPLSPKVSDIQQGKSSLLLRAANEIPEEPLNGAKAAVEPPVNLEEVYAPPPSDSNATDKQLESMIETTIITEGEPISSLVSGSRNSSSDSSLSMEHAAFAPPLTYKKFLTMQSKRVPVSIRYSAESGLKPFFLTVAQRVKESFPDVVLERVILPKVDVGESGFDSKGSFAGATFEVVVDNKIVVRTAPGRRVLQSNEMTVFVSMQELDVAISRARRRRRPSTVYGEGDDLEDEKSRLEVLKNKALEINARNSKVEKQS